MVDRGEASQEDKAPGQLRAASMAVRAAEVAYSASWSRLRKAAVSALVAGMSQQTILLQYRDLLNEDALASAREASRTKHEVASRARAASAARTGSAFG